MEKILSNEEQEELLNYIWNFIDQKCIFRCNPEIQYSHGIPKGSIPTKSPGSHNKWQMYLRNLTQDSDMVTAVCMVIVNKMVEKNMMNKEFQLVGLETSSIPLISHLQSNLRKIGKNVNSFSIRKERKEYGLFNLIDGIPNEHPFVVVDDIINSGSALIRVLDACLFELNLDPFEESFYVFNIRPERLYFPWNGSLIAINSLFNKTHFKYEYDESKYWIPFDCDKKFNKRPDYM